MKRFEGGLRREGCRTLVPFFDGISMEILVHVLVTALLLFVVARVVPGIHVRDGGSALVGAVILGLANAFVRPVIVFLTLPLSILTLGLFLLVVNALMLMLAAAVVDGFEVDGIGAGIVGSLLLVVMNAGVSLLFGI